MHIENPTTTGWLKQFTALGALVLLAWSTAVFAASENSYPLNFNSNEVVDVEFTQQPGEFSIVSVATHGIPYSLTQRSPATQQATENSNVVVSSDPYFSMQTRMLLTTEDCTQCIVRVRRDSHAANLDSSPLVVTTFNRKTESARFAAELEFRNLFRKGYFDDLDVDAGMTANKFRKLATSQDQLRACEIDLFRSHKDFHSKLKATNACLQTLEKQGDTNLIALFRVERARYLWYLDETAKAKTEINNILSASSTDAAMHTETLFVIANADLLLGMIENKKGNYDAADKHFDQATANFELLGEKTLLADALTERGVSLRFRNQLPEAAIALEKAYQAALNSVRRYPYQEANVKYNMAIVSALGGQYYHALRLVESLQPYADNEATPIWRAHILAAKARIVMELGRLDEAKALYDEVWTLYDSAGAKSHLATVANNLANLYIQQGDFEQARFYLEQARTFSGGEWGEEQNLRIRQAKVNYFQENGDLQSALQELDNMAPLVVASHDEYRHGRFLAQKAETLILTQQFEEALATLEQAIKFHTAADDNLYLTRSNYLTAVAQFNLQKPLNTIQEHLTKATDIIETTRSQMTDDRVRQEYFALQKDIYELAIKANLTLGKDQRVIESLYNAENFRARTLYESLLSDNQVAINSDAQLLQNSFRIFQHNAETKVLPKLTYEQLQNYKNQLPEGEALLYFFVGEQQSYLWFVASNQLELRLLPGNENLSEKILPLVQQMDSRPGKTKNESPWQQLVVNNRQVSDLILGPIAEQLRQVDKITIIPDGVLHRLPFAYLLDPNQAKPSPLIRSTTIKYASSIATDSWLNHEKPTVVHNKGILLIANPKLSDDATVVASLRSAATLADLPAAEQEARALMAMWAEKGESFILSREHATKANFKNAHPEQFQVIHFAGHATVDWDNPALSSIKLAPAQNIEDSTLESDDLTLQDIAALNLHAELVVLSACETAAGRLTTGEGPIGLSRAFFEAGSERVLASLWPVDDEATSLLLQFFYDGLLRQKLPPAEALRAAQMQMFNKSDYFHPFFWAGFVFVGNDESWLGKPTTSSVPVSLYPFSK